MTGGLKYVQWISGKSSRTCVTCGASLSRKRSVALTCSDRCRKIKNGQTRTGD